MTHHWIGDKFYHVDANPPEPRTETTDPTIRKLLGPKGETLLTISDRPPTGFHQGTKDHPRRPKPENAA